MILATVGTDTHQFNRLIEELDKLVENKKLKDRVIAQIGNCTYIPKNYEHFRFADLEKFDKLNNSADIIISHAGAGSLITSSQYGKPIIVVPRLKRYNEHTDNHQVQIAKELEKQNKIVAVYDVKNLLDAIRKIKNLKFVTPKKSNEISKIITEYILSLEMMNKK